MSMNAQSYLESFGWTPGTSLGNPSSHCPITSAPRLTKRILTSTKNNNHGLGKKASNLNHADLWWEKAFDVSLKNLDVTKDTSKIKREEKEVVNNMELFAELGGGRGFGGTAVEKAGQQKGSVQGVTGNGGLYRYFIPGGLLEGTVSIVLETPTETVEVPSKTDDKPSKKRKRDECTSTAQTLLDSKAERKAAKAAKATAKAERKLKKAERRAAKVERRKLRAERRTAKEEKKSRKAEKKAAKSARKEEQEPTGVQSDSGVDLSRDATPEVEAETKPKEKKKDKSSKKSKEKSTKSSKLKPA